MRVAYGCPIVKNVSSKKFWYRCTMCLFGLLAVYLNFQTNRILNYQLLYARLGSSGWEAWNTVFLSRRTALLYQRPFIQFKMASVEAFECDPDFCPRCGSILPLPGLLEVVSCTLCNFQKDTSGKSIKKFLDSNESNELSQSFQHACAASWVSRQSSKHPEN